MAVSSSSRPEWQQALFAIPKQRCSSDQAAMIKTIQWLEACDPLIFSKYDPDLHSTFNVRSPKLLKDLHGIVQFIINNDSIESVKYYVTTKQTEDTVNPESFLYTICSEICDDDLLKNSILPEDTTRMLLAAAILIEYDCLFNIYCAEEQADRMQQNIDLFEKLQDIVELGEELKEEEKTLGEEANPFLCLLRDPFPRPVLTSILGPTLSAADILAFIDRRMICLQAFMAFDRVPIDREEFQQLVEETKKEAQRYYSSTPIKRHGALERFMAPMAYYMNVISWSAHLIFRDDPEAGDSPFLKECFELSDVFLKLLRREIKEAKEAGEPFIVAAYTQMLLTALVYGVSEDDTDYAEVEPVAKDLSIALKNIKKWAPPIFCQFIELQLEQVNRDILHVIRTVLPIVPATGYSTRLNFAGPDFPIVDEKLRNSSTQLPMELVDALATDKTSCASCGKKSAKLLTCSACGLTKYCSKECQKQDWKSHKEMCKVVKDLYGRIS